MTRTSTNRSPTLARLGALISVLAALSGCNGTHSPPGGGPTFGQPCTSDGDCSGPGERCSNQAFPNGTIYPQPICIASCTVQDPTMLQPCEPQDSGVSLGYCVGSHAGQSGWCLPACSFDSTTYTVACAGQNACQVRGSGRDTGADAGADAARLDVTPIDTGVPVTPTGPTVYGIGVCWGGCKTDAECTGTDHCQVETGECLHTVLTYTKPVGAACDTTTDQSACSCLAPAGQTLGYCTRVCTTGGFDCMSGYSCSAQLARSGTVSFGGQPNGIQGHCLLHCTPAPPPAMDAGMPDTGSMVDAAMAETGLDVGSPEVGPSETGVPDAGARDVGIMPVPDAATPTACPNSVCGSTAGVSNVCLPGTGM